MISTRILRASGFWYYIVIFVPFVVFHGLFGWLALETPAVIMTWSYVIGSCLVACLQLLAVTFVYGLVVVKLVSLIPEVENVNITKYLIWGLLTSAVFTFQHVSYPMALNLESYLWYDLGVLAGFVGFGMYFVCTFFLAHLLCSCEANSMKPPIRRLLATWLQSIIWPAFLFFIKKRINQQITNLTPGDAIL